jgi:hypothetical protein
MHGSVRFCGSHGRLGKYFAGLFHENFSPTVFTVAHAASFLAVADGQRMAFYL